MFNNYLFHGGPGSGRWPRGFRLHPENNRSSGRQAYKRYAPDVSDEDKAKVVKQHNIDKAYKEAVEPKKKDRLGKIKNAVDQTNKLVDTAQRENAELMRKSVYKEKLNLSKMTDQEMRERINRQLLENQYNQLFAPEVSTVTKGQKAVDTALKVGGTVLTAGSTALSIALMIKELKK